MEASPHFLPAGRSKKKGKGMTVSIPADLQQALTARAAQRQISPEDLVREALVWYLQIDPEFLDELSAWQDVRDEALEAGAHG
jgi:hypothetical protein